MRKLVGGSIRVSWRRHQTSHQHLSPRESEAWADMITCSDEIHSFGKIKHLDLEFAQWYCSRIARIYTCNFG